MEPIVSSDTRTPDAFAFLTWDNDADGLVGSGNGNACEKKERKKYYISEAKTDDSYSGKVLIFIYTFHTIK